MKKIVALGLVLALFTAAASAQKGFNDSRKDRMHHGFSTGQLTRGEKFKMQKNGFEYKKMEHRFKRDGKLSPMEKRKLHKMKKQNRRDAFRFKHNHRKRS